jgi:hypothetical protein
MIAMQSMELDDEEKLDSILPMPMDKPDYPFGLRICLTEAEFEKLKLDPSEAEIGGMFHLHGLARVTSVSMTDGPNGKCCRVEAQIEDLGIESEDAENT